MREVELTLPRALDERQIEHLLEVAIARSGLQISLRHPGCVHWHVRNGRESGTLELTFWPAERRAWFTVQSGRTADWIDEAMDRIRRAIRRRSES